MKVEETIKGLQTKASQNNLGKIPCTAPSRKGQRSEETDSAEANSYTSAKNTTAENDGRPKE